MKSINTMNNVLRDVSLGISFFVSRKEFITYEQQYKTNVLEGEFSTFKNCKI